MSREIELLTEIRDLLLVVAEPALAKRDKKRRDALRRIGRGRKNVAAIMLMDGTRSQAEIVKESSVDKSQLSRLVKSLMAEALIRADEKHPKLVIAVPKDFFEGEGDAHD